MPYVPEDQRTTAYYLFTPRFSVKVPPMALRTLEDIKQFGTFSTGDAVIDRELAKNDVQCMLNIAEMEEVYRKGHPLKIVNYNDTKRIYDYIQAHLQFFKDFVMHSENRPPEYDKLCEDLINLDKFAAANYIHARHFFTTDEVHSLFGRHLAARRASLGITRVGGIRRSVPDVSKGVKPGMPKEPVDKTPTRISMEQLFNKEMDMNGATWK